jgi:hypothetical protein
MIFEFNFNLSDSRPHLVVRIASDESFSLENIEHIHPQPGGWGDNRVFPRPLAIADSGQHVT